MKSVKASSITLAIIVLMSSCGVSPCGSENFMHGEFEWKTSEVNLRNYLDLGRHDDDTKRTLVFSTQRIGSICIKEDFIINANVHLHNPDPSFMILGVKCLAQVGDQEITSHGEYIDVYPGFHCNIAIDLSQYFGKSPGAVDKISVELEIMSQESLDGDIALLIGHIEYVALDLFYYK